MGAASSLSGGSQGRSIALDWLRIFKLFVALRNTPRICRRIWLPSMQPFLGHCSLAIWLSTRRQLRKDTVAAWADGSPLPTAAAALSEQLQVLESLVVGHAVQPAVAVPVLQSVLRQLAVVEFEAAWAADPSAEGTRWVQFRCGGVGVGITLMIRPRARGMPLLGK